MFRCHNRGCRKVASDSFETRLDSMLLTCITPSQEYQPIRIINIIMPSICQVGIQEQCEHTSHSSQSQPAIKKRTSQLNPETSRDGIMKYLNWWPTFHFFSQSFGLLVKHQDQPTTVYTHQRCAFVQTWDPLS